MTIRKKTLNKSVFEDINIFVNLSYTFDQEELDELKISNPKLYEDIYLKKIFTVTIQDKYTKFSILSFSFNKESYSISLYINYIISELKKYDFEPKNIYTNKSSLFISPSEKNDSYFTQIVINKNNLKHYISKDLTSTSNNKFLNKIIPTSFDCKNENSFLIESFSNLLIYNYSIINSYFSYTKKYTQIYNFIINNPAKYFDKTININSLKKNNSLNTNNSQLLKNISKYLHKCGNSFIKYHNVNNKSLDCYNLILEIIKNSNIPKEFKAKQILNISSKYCNIKMFKESLKLANNAFLIANKIGAEREIGQAYFLIGYNHFIKGDFINAKKNYYKSIEIAKKINKNDSLIERYTFLSALYLYEDMQEKAILYISLAIDLSQKINDSELLASAYNVLGLIYIQQKKYNDAISIYNKRLEIVTKKYDYYDIALTYYNIGTLFYKNTEYDEAEKNYEIFMKYAKKDGRINTIFTAKAAIASIFVAKNESEKAIKIYKEIIKHDEKQKNNLLLVTHLENLGDIYSNCKNKRKAIEYYNKVLKIANQSKADFLSARDLKRVREAIKKLKMK